MNEPSEAQGQGERDQANQEMAAVDVVPERGADPFEALEPWMKEDAPPELVQRVRSVVQEARIAAYSGPLPTAG